MKLLIPLLSLGLLGATAADEGADAPSVPAVSAESRAPADADTERNCRDQIQMVREERGLPRIDREAASPDEPFLFKAVDHEVGGCDVLLVSDGNIRPLPEAHERPVRLIPAQ